jgi:hypothetical protein
MSDDLALRIATSAEQHIHPGVVVGNRVLPFGTPDGRAVTSRVPSLMSSFLVPQHESVVRVAPGAIANVAALLVVIVPDAPRLNEPWSTRIFPLWR